MAEPGELLARLTTAVAQTSPQETLSGRLCEAFRGMAGASSAALTVRYDELHRVTLTTTDEVAARLEDLQELIGEGPGYAAAKSGQIEHCLVPGADSAGRWTIFVESAQDLVGSAVIHAVPMRPHDEVFGVVTLYQAGASSSGLALGHVELQLLANALGAALAHDSSALDVDDTGPWSSRAQVHQATGMLIAQLHIGADDALALLRAHAYAHQSTLSDIALDVIERRLNFLTP